MKLDRFEYISVMLIVSKTISAQPVLVNFSFPDTICTGPLINITNQTSGGSTYYWNFCSGNTSYDPTGVNIGNPGNLLNIPVYMTLPRTKSNSYFFITNQKTQSVICQNFGSSFGINPITSKILGFFGILTMAFRITPLTVLMHSVSDAWKISIKGLRTTLRLPRQSDPLPKSPVVPLHYSVP